MRPSPWPRSHNHRDAAGRHTLLAPKSAQFAPSDRPVMPCEDDRWPGEMLLLPPIRVQHGSASFTGDQCTVSFSRSIVANSAAPRAQLRSIDPHIYTLLAPRFGGAESVFCSRSASPCAGIFLISSSWCRAHPREQHCCLRGPQSNDAYKARRRHRDVPMSGSPQMKAISAVIHILRIWRMQLHDAFLFIPEQVFYKAHLFPIRTAPRRRDRNMLPTRTNKSTYL